MGNNRQHTNHSLPMRVVDYFVSNRVMASMLAFIMLALGIMAIYNIRSEILPYTPLKEIVVKVECENSSPTTIEQLVTTPLEQSLKGLGDLIRYNSTSSKDTAEIYLYFKQHANMSEKLQAVSRQINQVELPDNVIRTSIKQQKFRDRIARLIISGPKSHEALDNIAQQLLDKLKNIGFRDAKIEDKGERNILIDVDKHTLIHLRRSLLEIADDIRSAIQPAAAGTIETNDKQRIVEKKDWQQPFGNIMIKLNHNNDVMLKYIADIKKHYKKTVWHYSRQNPATIIDIYTSRAQDEDVVAMGSKLEAWLNQEKNLLGKSVSLEIHDPLYQQVSSKISSLMGTGLQSFLIILSLLYITLGLRIATWVSLGIVLTFSASLGIFYLLGGSLNMISLMVFIMALGIVVDDSIIIAESAYHHFQEQGLKAKEAVLLAANKPSVVAACLTTVVVFFPMLTVKGIFSHLIKDIPLVMIAIISTSMIECFLIMPHHLYRSFKRYKEKPSLAISKKTSSKFNLWQQHVFKPSLYKLLNYHYVIITFCICLCFLSVTLLLTHRVQIDNMPNSVVNIFSIQLEMQDNASLNEAKKANTKIVNILKDVDKNRKSTITSRNLIIQSSVSRKLVNINVEVPKNYLKYMTFSQIRNNIQKNIGRIPKVKKIDINLKQHGLPGKDVQIRMQAITGVKLEQSEISNALKDIKVFLKTIPGIINLNETQEQLTDRVTFKLNDYAKKIGLSEQEINQQVSAAIGGIKLKTEYSEGQQQEVWLQLNDKQMENKSQLENIPIVTRQHQITYLGKVAELSYEYGPMRIHHSNGLRVMDIGFDINRNMTSVEKIRTLLTQKLFPELETKFPLAFSIEGKTGDSYDLAKDLQFKYIFVLLLIYAILTWCFQRYDFPLIIILTIPLAITGSIFGHYFNNEVINPITLFGIFMLSGIVVNDGILLLKTYQSERQKTACAQQAICEAVSLRLRPILLTSITTIAGMLPFLFVNNNNAPLLRPMAASISYGLIFITFLLLFFLPAALLVYIDIRNVTLKLWLKIRIKT